MSTIRKLVLYRFFNENDVPKFGCGWRNVIALPGGRKWQTLVDWTTLDVAHLTLKDWGRLRAEPVITRAAPVERAMRARIRLFETYVEAEKRFNPRATKYQMPAAVKEALKLLKGAP
jgi:hypothetical protein